MEYLNSRVIDIATNMSTLLKVKKNPGIVGNRCLLSDSADIIVFFVSLTAIIHISRRACANTLAVV